MEVKKHRFKYAGLFLAVYPILVILLAVIICLLIMVKVFALDLNPNETVTIDNTTVHCKITECSLYNYSFPDSVSSNLTWIGNVITSMNETVYSCLSLSINYTACVDNLNTVTNSYTDTKNTLDSLNADYKTCKEGNDEKTTQLVSEKNEYVTKYETCTKEISDYENTKYIYPGLGVLAGFGLAWYFFHKRVPESKGIETHTGRSGL